MTREEINGIVLAQREYFATGETLPVKHRRQALKRLYEYIKAHEREIADALYLDLGKSGYESFMCEVGMVLSEISYMIKHVGKFSRPRRRRTPLAQFAASSKELHSPYGCVLIMSPWNYPFLLSVDPLVDAIAAGNCAVLKPSAYSPATSEVVRAMAEECFSPCEVAVVTGGRQENAALLSEKFDMVFFTGSQAVGREVLRHTAETLTPAVLELGGKSPCIVDETAKLDLAARRIVFGKLLNCGQTCVAPDYIICHSSVKERLGEAIIKEIRRQYGATPLHNPDYGKIVSEKHFDRLIGLIDKEKCIIGGGYDRERLKIEPTVMTDVTPEDAAMKEEIFGPILPILTYDGIEELIAFISGREKPLALYMFSECRRNTDAVLSRVSFGGGCVNDVVIHLATSEMGFGGVGESGMGAYHGKRGFDAFSHTKSIVDKKTWMDLPMRYQPYKNRLYEKLLRMFLK